MNPECMTFGNNEKQYLPLEEDYISGADEYKDFGVLFTKNGNSNKEIYNRINNGRNIVRSINSILWDKSLKK
jgi:hypothetical protein